MRAAGLEHRGGDTDPLGPVVAGIGVVVGVIFLGVVVAGPAPVVGTRWFWFWLIVTAPYGLGLLFWVARDRPWSRSATPAAASGGSKRRDRGILGFAIGIFTMILISVLLFTLHEVLGDRWVPHPDP